MFYHYTQIIFVFINYLILLVIDNGLYETVVWGLGSLGNLIYILLYIARKY